MTRIEEYLSYLDHYTKEYGSQTIVLYQCGKFFEIYGIQNEEENVGCVYQIGELLNFQVTRADKSIPTNSRKNPLLCGFPLSSIDNVIPILLRHQYTVVLVEQVTPPPHPTRKVTKVISPSTYIEQSTPTTSNERTSRDSTYFICGLIQHHPAYQHRQRSKTLNYLTITPQCPKYEGVLIAYDMTTGTPAIFYSLEQTSGKDTSFLFDEMYRFIHTYHPCEILLYHDMGDTTEWSECLEHIEIPFSCIQHIRSIQNDIPKSLFQISIQNKLLHSYFPETGHLSPIEYLNMERSILTPIVYLLMLQFIEKHNPTLVTHLQIPVEWNASNHLILEHNAITQLNVDNTSSSSTQKSLLRILNRCQTPLGRRLFRRNCLNPIIDTFQLKRQYNAIECLRQTVPCSEWDKLISIKKGKEITKGKSYGVLTSSSDYSSNSSIAYILRNHMREIGDIERIWNKMKLGLLQPPELSKFHSGIQTVCYLYQSFLIPLTDIYKGVYSKELEQCMNESISLSNPFHGTTHSILFDKLQNCIQDYTSHIDMEKAKKYNLHQIEETIFYSGMYPMIDRIQEKINLSMESLKKMEDSLVERLGVSQSINKISTTKKKKPIQLTIGDSEDGTDTFFVLSKPRWKIMKESLETKPITINGTTISWDNFHVDTRNKSNCKISCDFIIQQSQEYLVQRRNLIKQVQQKYVSLLNHLTTTYDNLFRHLFYSIAQLDVLTTHAHNSLEFGYVQPIIDDTVEHSYIKARDLRHPIIERLDTRIPYTPHTFDLNYSKKQQGILLYGVNSSGKSSVMKAVGLATIMAQSGMYVPAMEFTFHPYRKICTRILGNDNLFRGLSSFAVEMSELRGILYRADPYTLVLGDEVCHGTEQISAISIVASSLVELTNVGASYMFATHLHELSQLTLIQKLQSLRIYHLSVRYDEERDCLIYERKLKKGTGSSLYGLEVARAMKLPNHVLQRAHQVRTSLFSSKDTVNSLGNDDEENPVKISRYNKKVVHLSCEICGKPSEEVHHIQFQEQSDEMGHVDERTKCKKNATSNLVPLCQEHHEHVHHGRSNDGNILVIHGYVQDTSSCGYHLSYEYRSKKKSLLHS